MSDEVGVRAQVVHDLWEQAAPVDGVGRAERQAVALSQFRGERRVVEDRFDRALAVVEVAAETEHREVVARLGDHLQLLQRRDPRVRVEDADARVGAVRVTVERRHARVAAGRHQDEVVELRRAPGVRLFQRLAEVERHALQRHIFEGERRPVPQLEHVPPRGDLAHRGHLRMVEARAVGARRDRARRRRLHVEAERLVDRSRAPVVRQVRQGDDLRDGERGKTLRDEQAAPGGDPGEDGLGEGAGLLSRAAGVPIADHGFGILQDHGPPARRGIPAEPCRHGQRGGSVRNLSPPLRDRRRRLRPVRRAASR